MSSRTVYPPAEPATGPPRPEGRYVGEDDGSGWVAFAGIMLVIAGVLNFIYGWAAVDAANFYISNAQYVISDLDTWGWVLMAVGVIQFGGAMALFFGLGIGRWIGIASAGINAIAQLLAIPGYPLLSISLFAIDVLIIYGLVAHGGRRSSAV
jgi:hypothetical protein